MARRSKRSSSSRPDAARVAPGAELVAPLDDAVKTGRLPVAPRRPPISGRPGTQPALDLLSHRDDLLPPSAERPRLIPVARVGKTWGVRGHNTVRLYNDDSELPWAADVMLVRGDGIPLTAVEVDEWEVKGARILLRFTGIHSPQAAQQLVNLELLCHPDELPEADDGSIYVHELIGMEVHDTERGLLGLIADVIVTGANDVWLVQGEGGEVMIPALKQFVLDIDRDARRVSVSYEEI